MIVRLISFTDKGEALARKLADLLPGVADRCNAPEPLAPWTARWFAGADALVFVGAAGIAVRAIAPHVSSKATDPAVVVVDEGGRFAVPILSGHLGGANDLARRIGGLLGAEPVVTTATDLRGLFPVDQWARVQHCAIPDPERIKGVSARLLAGETVALRSDWPISGPPPEGVRVVREGRWDVALTLTRPEEEGLCLVPRIATLGVGCRRGTERAALEGALQTLLDRSRVFPQAICKVCTIDIKQGEPGLAEFCRARGLPLETFSAGALAGAEGEFSASPFVERTVGVDNVCERAAVLGSGGALVWKKTAGNGVTMALALAPFAPDWRWKDE